MAIFHGRIKERRASLGGRYEISDRGIVYSDGLPLSAIDGVGVNLGGRRIKIAQLVAKAFVEGKSAERCWVRHLNGDVRDNRAENLEWSDEREEPKRGRKPVERWIRAWNLEGYAVGQWRNVKEASMDTRVAESGIRACLRGERRSAGGLLWGGLAD